MLIDLKKEEDGLRLELVTLSNGELLKDKIYIIQEGEPYRLWDMLYDFLGYPHMVRERRTPEEEEEDRLIREEILRRRNGRHVSTAVVLEKKIPAGLEEELETLKSREIIEKVHKDLGVKITVSVKSKKNVIKHALRAYAQKDSKDILDSLTYIPLSECIDGNLYKIKARNAMYGVFRKDQKSFMIARQKGNIFLTEEFHWDTGSPHGTAKPLKNLGTSKVAVAERGSLLEYLKGLEGYKEDPEAAAKVISLPMPVRNRSR